jgi:glutamate N-acetyltransferase/amino-acid N-acetyltransferase
MPDLVRSPLAPPRFPDLPDIGGVRFAVARAGYKAWDRTDLTLAAFDPGTTVAGVLTRSKCPSPEVDWCRKALRRGAARVLVVNAGNSNAFTGGRGEAAVRGVLDAATAATGCKDGDVFVASTGVIGVPLPVDKAKAGLAAAFAKLNAGSTATWEDAAATIMTTDTFPKGASARAVVDGRTVSVAGIAKGSGMIAPDMATMLAFLFTDAAVSADALQAMLSAACETTFNCTTVDGDTSTSDTLLAFATGAARNAPVSGTESAGYDALAAAVHAVCLDLAQQVVRDGEGAQKFVTVTIEGAESDGAAKRIALSVANSPLVKTAIAGEDANWGRVVMAVGKAGEAADRDRLTIRFGATTVAERGEVVPGYDEAPVAAHLKGREIDIGVNLGLGDGRATVWTCDLTHGYISINADYRS